MPARRTHPVNGILACVLGISSSLSLDLGFTTRTWGQGDNPFRKEPVRKEPVKRKAVRKPPSAARPTAPATPATSATQPANPTTPVTSSTQPANVPLPLASRPVVNTLGMEMLPLRFNGRVLYFSKYEVTQQQWYAVMGNNPSYQRGDAVPVNRVSLEDVLQFIETLNQLERNSSFRYRLPTVEEWEFAARGSGLLNLDVAAWYQPNSGGRPRPVGGKQANGFGLHDMFGNVWEWCTGGFIRGGAYDSPAEQCGPGGGRKESPQVRDSNIGFRLVATPVAESPRQ